MRTTRWAGLVLALVAGCAEGPVEPQDENVIVPPGKEDNFFSNVAQEYMATSQVTFRLDESYADRTAEEQLARARQIMEGKTQQIGWFLHVYLIDKSNHDEHADYGGLRAMVLDGSYESDALKQDPDDPLSFSYGFAVQVGGSRQLLAKVRSDQGLEPDADTFQLQMAAVSNSKLASHFSHTGYSPGSWSPDSCECELETIPIKLEPIEASKDAYFDQARFMEDDVIDISVHFGWDYHARYDITHSRQLYTWLVETMGFTSPTESYEQYNRLSGPLTKTLEVNGRTVTAKVTLFRPDPCEAWDEDGEGGAWDKAVEEDEANKRRACDDWAWDDPAKNANPTTSAGAGNLMQDLKQSLRTRDAVIFTGHSGYTYAYALASWYKTSAGDLDPPEIKTLELPADKSQLFVLSGCDTYHVAQAFKDNPNKLGLHNADVVTTTSFSNAGDVSDTQAIIEAMVGDKQGTLNATSYGKVMQQLNPTSYDYGWGFFTMFGVHGIDDNPLANPLGDASQSCAPCESDQACGAVGNVCVRLNETEKVCAVECLDDAGCAEGQVCRQFGSSASSYIRGKACVPSTYSCNVQPPPEPEEQHFSVSGAVSRGEEQHYSVPVGTDATEIEVRLSGDGDADLYTRFSEAPTTSDYDCRPYRAGSSESCSHDTAGGATLEIMVRGYAKQNSSYTVDVTWK